MVQAGRQVAVKSLVSYHVMQHCLAAEGQIDAIALQERQTHNHQGIWSYTVHAVHLQNKAGVRSAARPRGNAS
jgi:hypothetical protein